MCLATSTYSSRHRSPSRSWKMDARTAGSTAYGLIKRCTEQSTAAGLSISSRTSMEESTSAKQAPGTNSYVANPPGRGYSHAKPNGQRVKFVLHVTEAFAPTDTRSVESTPRSAFNFWGKTPVISAEQLQFSVRLPPNLKSPAPAV